MNNESGAMEYSNSGNTNAAVPSSNCVCYGPIRYFARKGKAPTLITGRKSKFEQLDGEEEMKRELRRQKNRLLSQQLKEKREKIFSDLLTRIDQLEREQSHLCDYIQQLQEHRDDLLQEMEDIQQDPLANLIQQNEMALFFEEHDHQDFDTDLLISTLKS